MKNIIIALFMIMISIAAKAANKDVEFKPTYHTTLECKLISLE